MWACSKYGVQGVPCRLFWAPKAARCLWSYCHSPVSRGRAWTEEQTFPPPLSAAGLRDRKWNTGGRRRCFLLVSSRAHRPHADVHIT